MKLYTKSQVLKMLEICRDSDLYDHIITFEDILRTETPLELPSDEDIFQRAIKEMTKRYGSNSKIEVDVYFRGAMWMKQQIKEDNK